MWGLGLSCVVQVDTMVVQAIGLLDDLDKEINTYSMRIKEWYGWHFPEMQKIVVDNTMYAKTVVELGMIKNAKDVRRTHSLVTYLVLFLG